MPGVMAIKIFNGLNWSDLTAVVLELMLKA